MDPSVQSIQKNLPSLHCPCPRPLPGTQRFLDFVQPKSQPAVDIILISSYIYLWSRECMKSIETSHNLCLNRKNMNGTRSAQPILASQIRSSFWILDMFGVQRAPRVPDLAEMWTWSQADSKESWFHNLSWGCNQGNRTYWGLPNRMQTGAWCFIVVMMMMMVVVVVTVTMTMTMTTTTFDFTHIGYPCIRFGF